MIYMYIYKPRRFKQHDNLSLHIETAPCVYNIKHFATLKKVEIYINVILILTNKIRVQIIITCILIVRV